MSFLGNPTSSRGDCQWLHICLKRCCQWWALRLRRRRRHHLRSWRRVASLPPQSIPPLRRSLSCVHDFLGGAQVLKKQTRFVGAAATIRGEVPSLFTGGADTSCGATIGKTEKTPCVSTISLDHRIYCNEFDCSTHMTVIGLYLFLQGLLLFLHTLQ